MARGKHKVRAENRRAHLDNEVMQKLKEENSSLNAKITELNEHFNEQLLKQDLDIEKAVEARTREVLADSKAQMEMIEDTARAFVQARTEELIALCMSVADVVPSVTRSSSSHAPLFRLLQANGVEDYHKFFASVMKANGLAWHRHQTRNMRRTSLIDHYWAEAEGSWENMKAKTVRAMKEVSKRHHEQKA